MRIRLAALVAAVLTGVVVAPAQAAPTGHIRLDQIGYGVAESKQAYLLGGAANTTFTVVDSKGKTVLTGKTGASTGSWSAKFTAVHPIDFSKVKVPGTYRIKVGATTSSAFKVDTQNKLFAPVAHNTVEFFQAQRDGADVIPGRLDRKPAHLTDRQAAVYETPVFKGEGGDEIAAPLKATGQTVDLEGGWFDAGDFVKFTHASSYSTASMLLALRDKPNAALAAEAKFGLKWLDKAWDEKTGTLYAQVGIGTGSEEFGFLGDHDVWRLPEADDKLDVKPGDAQYYIKNRPVFRANAAGEKISPNLVGRVAGLVRAGLPDRVPPEPAPRVRVPGEGREALRAGQDREPRRARDRVPARLLPRGLVGRRPRVRRHAARAGGQGARRQARSRVRQGRDPLGQGLPEQR